MRFGDDQIRQISKTLNPAAEEDHLPSAPAWQAIRLPAEGERRGGLHRRKAILFAALVAAVFIHGIACPAPAEPAKAAAPATQPAEPWAKTAPQRRPQLVLT